jgi:hypothetical protein
MGAQWLPAMVYKAGGMALLTSSGAPFDLKLAYSLSDGERSKVPCGIGSLPIHLAHYTSINRNCWVNLLAEG